MKQDIPTGIEIIHNSRLNKQILIDLPKSKFKIHGLQKPNKRWDVSIINPLGACKRSIVKNLETKAFKVLIAWTLADKHQTEFKNRTSVKEPGINKLAIHYKSIIKGFKA